MSELISAMKKAIQEEVRRGYRDDCKAQVEAAFLKIIELLDARYAPKKKAK